MTEVESKLEDFNIYCTSADSPQYTNFIESSNALFREIKTSAILGKYVYISASHIFDAPHTLNLIYDNPELIESGLVSIGLYSTCRDFADFSLLRADNRSGEIKKEKELAKWLDNHTHTIMRWTPTNLQPIFKSSILHSLDDKDTSLRKRLTATKGKYIVDLIKSIEHTPTGEITRTRLYNLAKQHIPHRTNAFMREINAFYYTIGACSKSLIPHYSPILFQDISQDISIKVPKGISSQDTKDAFEYLLKEFLFSPDILEHLTINDIISFREKFKPDLATFRKKWWDTIGKSTEYNNGIDKSFILSALSDIAKKEIKRVDMYKKGALSLSVIALIGSFASMIPSPYMAAISSLVSLISYVASLENNSYKIVNAKFYSLCTKLQKSAFNES